MQESKVALARVAVSGDDPRVRHTAFIALRRLHHLPPTLFSPEQQAMRFEQSDAAEADQPVVSRFRLGVSAAAEPSPVQLDQQSMDAPSLLSSGAGDVSAGALPAISGVSLKIPLGQRASTSVVNPADGAVQQPTDALVTTGLLEGEAVLNEQVVSENVGQGASMAQTAAAPAPASTGEQGPSAVANKPGLIKLGINKNLI